ncbi:MAG: MEKHLA domain-containing protein [Gammaproteobacteria bacterium]
MIACNNNAESRIDCNGWSQWLLNSYALRTGRELLARSGDANDEAQRLFAAPFVVVSHDSAADPVLNYGNRVALELWELTWAEFIRLPSRLTAEMELQCARQQILDQVAKCGFVDGYSGVRISASGRRFRILDATIWEVQDQNGIRVGQAATFRHWTDA